MEFIDGQFGSKDCKDCPSFSFNKTELVNGESPETVKAYLVGHQCLVEPLTVELELKHFVFVMHVQFGEARLVRADNNTKWSSNGQYYVCKAIKGFHQGDLLIVEHNGLGLRFFLASSDFANLLQDLLIEKLEPSQKWDLLYHLCGTQAEALRQGYVKAAREYSSAFVADRLKKRKKNRIYEVYIESDFQHAEREKKSNKRRASKDTKG